MNTDKFYSAEWTEEDEKIIRGVRLIWMCDSDGREQINEFDLLDSEIFDTLTQIKMPPAIKILMLSLENA